MKAFSCIAALGISALLGVCARADVVELTYRVIAPGSNELVNLGGASCALQDRAPDNARDLPKFNAEKPLFGKLFGNRLAVLDKSAPDAKAWDILWLDCNGDGKLQPKERFTFKRGEQSGDERVVLAPVEFPGDDGPSIEHFRLRYYAPANQAPKHLNLTPAGYYYGTAKFGDKSYALALVDDNANGRFDDVWRGEERGDLILIDWGHKGHFDNYGPDYKDAAWVGKYLFVDGRYWATQIAPDGSSITLTPSQAPTGRLQANEADLTLTVAGDNGRFKLSRTKAEDPFLLPMGTYRLDSTMIARTDDHGQMWVLRGTGWGRKGTTFEVKPDATAEIKVGAPLVAKASAEGASPGQTGRSFSLSLTGADGLTYQVSHDRGGMDYPPAPQLQLKSKDGKVAEVLTFAYG